MTLSFFFSSRRRHTRYWRDWSSDVCSSDLVRNSGGPSRSDCRSAVVLRHELIRVQALIGWPRVRSCATVRSEERRVGKSVDLGGRRIIKKKNFGEGTSEHVSRLLII